MRFLDLDLDFFLNDNPYSIGCDRARLSSKYKPWSVLRVRHFLEERCGLSSDAPVLGRTVETHDGVFNFWQTLIESGGLEVPFEVTHIDAHPDIWVGNELCLLSELLYVDTELVLEMLNKKHIHAGNYLTFAIAYRWIASLVWVPLRSRLKGQSKWDGDARSILIQFKKRKAEYPKQDLPMVEKYQVIPFKILSWRIFRTSETFDYIAFSKSPDFTPPESDKLIPVIEKYIRQI